MSPCTQIHQPRGVQVAGLRNTTEGEAKKEKPACTEQLPLNLAAAVCALHTPRASARRWQGVQTHLNSYDWTLSRRSHSQGDLRIKDLDPQPPQFSQPPQTLQVTVERGRNTDCKLAGVFLAPDK